MLYPFELRALVESIALAPIASTVTFDFVQFLCGFSPETLQASVDCATCPRAKLWPYLRNIALKRPTHLFHNNRRGNIYRAFVARGRTPKADEEFRTGSLRNATPRIPKTIFIE